MNALLQQFMHESRDLLQSISQQLLLLEQNPNDEQVVVELFRSVHTLKGNSGLFEFSAMTQVLHAAEDLMDAVRDGSVSFTPNLADQLLDSMDFVAHLLDEIASERFDNQEFLAKSQAEVIALRSLMSGVLSKSQANDQQPNTSSDALSQHDGNSDAVTDATTDHFAHQHQDCWSSLPSAVLAQFANYAEGFMLVCYQPESSCFFKGEDPFNLVQQLPATVWGMAKPSRQGISEAYDCFNSELIFYAITSASSDQIAEHFRYVPEQVCYREISSFKLTTGSEQTSCSTRAVQLDPAVADLLQAQLCILQQQNPVAPLAGIMASVWQTLSMLVPQIEGAPQLPMSPASTETLLRWLKQVLSSEGMRDGSPAVDDMATDKQPAIAAESLQPQVDSQQERPEQSSNELAVPLHSQDKNTDSKLAARQDESSKILKVEQSKIDRLMDLIGEIVVAKNALPYLANKAEDMYGSRELAREIKAQYAVINRIVEEMQDSIMQVRMMPVSFIFQRFPRLVRDIARKLAKEVDLQIFGEQTEADKNIIESLADPLIHIIRNSLDHGLETPSERIAQGKPAVGVLKITAKQESDRVLIVIADDGRGINPTVIKQKAWEKQIISEEQLEKLSDQEAIQLIFAAGFSTAEAITDLSGRGVGMDVVKNAVQKVGGAVHLQSQVGIGTQLTLSLPLSMAVTNVMVVGSDEQIFGIPMDLIVETVRLPIQSVRPIKQQLTTVLRGRLIPLLSLNQLLGIDKPQLLNDEREHALLVVKTKGEVLGVLVDDFYEVIDIILKPLPGELSKMPLYAGSALLGDGSVLLILNPQEFSE